MRTVAVNDMVTNLASMAGIDTLLTSETNAAIRSFNRFGRLGTAISATISVRPLHAADIATASREWCESAVRERSR